MRPSASQSWPLVAPDWIQNGPEWLNDFGYDVYKSFIFDDRYQMYIKGLGNTLLLTLLALLTVPANLPWASSMPLQGYT